MAHEVWCPVRAQPFREMAFPMDKSRTPTKMWVVRARSKVSPPRMTRESRKLLAIRQAGELNGHSEEHDRSNQTGRSRQPIRLFSSRAFLLVFSRRPFRRGPTCA